MGADLPQLAVVERGRHLEHSTEEDTVHAQLSSVVETAQRTALPGLRDLAPIDANAHHRVSPSR